MSELNNDNLNSFYKKDQIDQAADSAKAKANSAFADVFGPVQPSDRTASFKAADAKPDELNATPGSKDDISKLFGNAQSKDRTNDLKAGVPNLTPNDLKVSETQSRNQGDSFSKDDTKLRTAELDNNFANGAFKISDSTKTGQASDAQAKTNLKSVDPKVAKLAQDTTQANIQASLAADQVKHHTAAGQSKDGVVKFNNTLTPQELSQLKNADNQRRQQALLGKANFKATGNAKTGQGKAAATKPNKSNDKGKTDDGPDFD